LRDYKRLKEHEQEWTPIVKKTLTDKEKAEYLAENGEELCYMLENEMPLDGQEVLVSIGKFVLKDVFNEDSYNFKNNDIKNVDAWMPLPKSYEQQESEKS
jgi:regulatory protein YycI of two-component signal transduction system YycFG